MRLKNGFMLREVAGQWIVVPLGDRVVEFNGLMTLSESGALLWKMLVDGSDEDTLAKAILAEYDIDEKTAKSDVLEFITALKEKDLFEE